MKRPELPSFKPVLKSAIYEISKKPPSKIPCLEEGRVVVSVNLVGSPESVTKLWLEGRLAESVLPSKWQCFYMEIKEHENLKQVKELCPRGCPQEILDLYSPVWQLRFVLQRPGSLLKKSQAAVLWDEYWAKLLPHGVS